MDRPSEEEELTIILVSYVDQVMSQAEETSSQNLRDFLRPTHQLQTSLG